MKFTLEVEQNGKLLFLDICIEHYENTLSSTWYCKPTDTGLILNFHAMAPKRYKRSVIQCFVYRIYRVCSSWKKIHESLIKAKDILDWNQYPPNFYEPIISATVEKIVKPGVKKVNNDDANNENLPAKVNLIIQYQRLKSDNFIKQLKRSNAPIQPVVTLRKQNVFLPSLKPNGVVLHTKLLVQVAMPAMSAKLAGTL